jgi:hypothetical protein
MLLASVLAIGAAAFASCGDTDCPSTGVTPLGSCSSAGLTCLDGESTCKCVDGKWQCAEFDLPMSIRDMSMPRDLTPESD